jgi:hypothetical protein
LSAILFILFCPSPPKKAFSCPEAGPGKNIDAAQKNKNSRFFILSSKYNRKHKWVRI